MLLIIYNDIIDHARNIDLSVLVYNTLLSKHMAYQWLAIGANDC